MKIETLQQAIKIKRAIDDSRSRLIDLKAVDAEKINVMFQYHGGAQYYFVDYDLFQSIILDLIKKEEENIILNQDLFDKL